MRGGAYDYSNSTSRCAYKKGAKTQISDAVSRLRPYAPKNTEADFEIPCFVLSEEGAPVAVVNADVASWTELD